jgi:hypothetical protein
MSIVCKFQKEDESIQLAVYYLYKSGPGRYPIFVISFMKEGNNFIYSNTRVPPIILKKLIDMDIVEYDEPFLKLTTKSLLDAL